MNKLITVVVLMTLANVSFATAQQTRVYDARGRSVGTIVPDSQGSTRAYDARGRSIGTSSTDSSGTTTYYDAGGRVISRTNKR